MRTIFINLILVFFVFGVNAQTAKYENFDSATSLLASYYDAINQKDYRRAYGYWQTPPQNYEEFVKGFAETGKIRLIVEPPDRIEGAAGSLYVEIPTVLIAAQNNGKSQIFAGCYMLRKSNLRPPERPKEDVWHIYRANIKTVSPDAEIPPLLENACQENESKPNGRQPARVLGVIGFDDGRLLNNAIKLPETVEVNKEFQITVTTSGGGCESAGDTGVFQTDNSADVFIYDLTTATHPEIACTLILKRLEHTATLKFKKPGEAVIRVWARKLGGKSPYGEPVIVERRVKVQ